MVGSNTTVKNSIHISLNVKNYRQKFSTPSLTGKLHKWDKDNVGDNKWHLTQLFSGKSDKYCHAHTAGRGIRIRFAK